MAKTTNNVRYFTKRMKFVDAQILKNQNKKLLIKAKIAKVQARLEALEDVYGAAETAGSDLLDQWWKLDAYLGKALRAAARKGK